MINFFKLSSVPLDHAEMRAGVYHLCTAVSDVSYDYRLVMNIIKKDVSLAYWYARNIINCRWPEGEPIIMTNPVYSSFYAQYCIRGRWTEGEPVIMKDPKSAYRYASSILKERWLEAEIYIQPDEFWWYNYCREFNI